MRSQALSEAKQLVHSAQSGVVSTISHNLRGYPFGSVTPFISCSEGKLYFYISDIAQHAKNLSHDCRMSVTVFEQALEGDQNAHGRVTLVGDAKKLDSEQAELVLQRYIMRYPEAESYQQAHDFHLWQMNIVRVRYIGGFGKIFWIEPEEWQSAASPWDYTTESRMIAHMNEDHVDAMALILAQHHGVDDNNPQMSGIQTQGCYLRSGERNYFVPFETPCQAAGDVRTELVKLTQQARQAA